MALDLRINAEFGEDSIVVYDTTCTFNSGSNEGGWGLPNKLTSNAVSAYVDITNGIEHDAATAIRITDIYPTLPNSTGVGYEISDDDLALTELEVGVWTIKYVVTFSDDTTEETTCHFLNDCAVQSCLDGRAKLIDVSKTTAYDQETFRLQMILKGAWANMCNGDYDKADELIRYVGEKCDCCC